MIISKAVAAMVAVALGEVGPRGTADERYPAVLVSYTHEVGGTSVVRWISAPAASDVARELPASAVEPIRTRWECVLGPDGKLQHCSLIAKSPSNANVDHVRRALLPIFRSDAATVRDAAKYDAHIVLELLIDDDARQLDREHCPAEFCPF